MLSRCRDELECDLAETYGFSGELKELSTRKAAVFACGLRPDCRTLRKLGGMTFGISDGEAAVINRLGEIAYFAARGAGFKAKRPKPLDLTIHEKKNEVRGFGSAEEFERELEKIRKGGTA